MDESAMWENNCMATGKLYAAKPSDIFVVSLNCTFIQWSLLCFFKVDP